MKIVFRLFIVCFIVFILAGCFGEGFVEYYTVTFETRGGTTIKKKYVQEGYPVPIPSTTREGYTIDGWYTSLDDGQTLYEKWSFSNSFVYYDVTLYANWIINQYTITFDSNGGDGENAITQDYNTELNLPTPIREGYTFCGWFEDEKLEVEFKSEKVPSRNITLFASWITNSNEIVFDANGGEGEMENQFINTDEIETLNLNNFIKDGYTFIGWSKSTDGVVEYFDGANYTMDISNSTTLYAQWEVKKLKILLIGNSYSEDASNNGQGMNTSKLFDIIKDMLGVDANVVIGLCYSGGKAMAWHASKAEENSASYSLRYISNSTNVWKNAGVVTSAQALQFEDWDIVTLQPHGAECTTGVATPYGNNTENENPLFFPLNASLPYMIDHIALYAPQAAIYYYATWSNTSINTVFNAGLSDYIKRVRIMKEAMDYVGSNSGKGFNGLIPVGTAIQNARTTYLAFLDYNNPITTGVSINLTNDNQVGLLRDGGHLSFIIGRYIAALTFAEILVPVDMRKENYHLSGLRISDAIGQPPSEYEIIAKQAVAKAIESTKKPLEDRYLSTILTGYEVDPADLLKDSVEDFPIILSSELLNNEIIDLIIETINLLMVHQDYKTPIILLPEDFQVIPDTYYTITVSLQYGYSIRNFEKMIYIK